jgi:hypothetical protein
LPTFFIFGAGRNSRPAVMPKQGPARDPIKRLKTKRKLNRKGCQERKGKKEKNLCFLALQIGLLW